MKKKYNYFTTIIAAFKQAFKDAPGIVILSIFIMLLYIPNQIVGLILVEEVTNKSYEFISGVETSFWPAMEKILLLTVSIFIMVLLHQIYNILWTKLSYKLSYNYEKRILTKLSNLTLENYETQEVDSKINLIKNSGYYVYANVAIYDWQSTFYSFVGIGIFIFFTTRLPWWVVLIFIASCIVYIILGTCLGKKLFKKYDELELTRQRRNYFYFSTQSKETHQDSIMNRLTIPFIKRWRKLNDYWNDESLKMAIKGEIYEIIPSFVYAAIAVFILFFVINSIASGNQEIGYFTLMVTSIVKFGETLRNLGYSFQYQAENNSTYKSYLEIIELEEDMKVSDKKLSNNFEIELNNITYTYPQSDIKALNGLNLKFKENEIIAVVGHNGSGKTTFVNVLMELTKNYQGDVIVNGENINNELGIIRNSSSCIFQDFLQYSFTIKQNICLGNINKEFTDEEIEEILDKVGLLEFVKEMPDSINTMLGQIEKGTELSKGQWQRLAIGRLLANEESKIWVFDEPTAFLDPIAEIEVYDLIKSLKTDKTIFFISHRLGFSRTCNRVIVFKDGAIAEDDSPQNLLEKNSIYKEMYETQKKWYE